MRWAWNVTRMGQTRNVDTLLTCSQNCEKRLLASSCLSVWLTVRPSVSPHGTIRGIFKKFDIWAFFSETITWKFIFGIKLYMFRTVPLSIIRNFSLYTEQCYMCWQLASRIRMELQFLPDPSRKMSANLYGIYHCCVYSEKLLMMDRGILQNT